MATDVQRAQLRELLHAFSDEELTEALGPRAYVSSEVIARQLAVTQATIRKWVRDNVIPPSCYIKVGMRMYRFQLGRVIEALENYQEAKDMLPDPDQLKE